MNDLFTGLNVGQGFVLLACLPFLASGSPARGLPILEPLAASRSGSALPLSRSALLACNPADGAPRPSRKADPRLIREGSPLRCRACSDVT